MTLLICPLKLPTSLALFLFLSFTAAGQSQQNAGSAAEFSPQKSPLVAAAREIMVAARYCALITQDSPGHLQARAVDAFAPDEDMVVWLGTNPRSRKVAAIRRDPRVTLYYFDREAQAYVTFHGIAQLVDDPKAKLKWWKDDWKAFYPNRTTDYLLIKVTPEWLEVVNVSKGILGDQQTWLPPSVRFKGRVSPF